MAIPLGNGENQYHLWRNPIDFLTEVNLDHPFFYGRDSRNLPQIDDHSIFTRFVRWYRDDRGCLGNFGRMVAKIAAVVAVVLTSVIGVGILAGYKWHQTARQIDQRDWNTMRITDVNRGEREWICRAIGLIETVANIPVKTIPQGLVQQIENQGVFGVTENQGLRYDVTENQDLKGWLDCEFASKNAHALQGFDPYGRAYLAVRVVDEEENVHYGMLHQLYRECDAERGWKWYGSGVLAHDPEGQVFHFEITDLPLDVRGWFNNLHPRQPVYNRITSLFQTTSQQPRIRLAVPNA